MSVLHMPNLANPSPSHAPGWRARLQHWFWARLPRHDRTVLQQRNLYILPTGAGWLLLVTLLVLLPFASYIVGEYIGRIYLSINRCPQYVVRNVIDRRESTGEKDETR